MPVVILIIFIVNAVRISSEDLYRQYKNTNRYFWNSLISLLVGTPLLFHFGHVKSEPGRIVFLIQLLQLVFVFIPFDWIKKELFPPNIEKLKAKKNVNGLVQIILYKKDIQIIQEATNALIKIGEPAIESLLQIIKKSDYKPYDSVVDYAIEALGKIGKEAISQLLEIISSKEFEHNSYVSNNAQKALVHIGEPAVEPLIKALAEVDNENCKEYIAEALGKLKDKRAVKPLIANLTSEKWRVRENVLLALGYIQSEEAIEPILKLILNEKEEQVRNSAISVIVNYGNMAIKHLHKYLDIRNNHAHEIARILKRMNWQPENEIDKANFLLLQFEYNELAEMGNVAVDPLIQCLDSKDMGIKLHAIEILGQIADEKALDPLIKIATDKNNKIRNEVFEALKNFKDKSAIQMIEVMEENERKILSKLREEAGSKVCVRCEQAKNYWSRKVLSKSPLLTQGLSTIPKPEDFAGVCTNCQDGFCIKHAPDGQCPFCGNYLN